MVFNVTRLLLCEAWKKTLDRESRHKRRVLPGSRTWETKKSRGVGGCSLATRLCWRGCRGCCCCSEILLGRLLEATEQFPTVGPPPPPPAVAAAAASAGRL
ncbi:unnamed protein product [Ectocarpus sp. 8 AP-2014]